MTDMQAAEEIGRAEASIEAGDLDGATAIAERILSEDPQHTGAMNVIGYAAYRQFRLLDAHRWFKLAGDDPDALANLAVVEAEITAVEEVRTSGRTAPPDFALSIDDLQQGAIGRDLSPRMLGALLSSPFEEELEARINQLPSAASANERRFLLRFAARLWDGEGDIFENGPLLGGTTRGLALGMLANPRRQPDARLHTFDWFSAAEGDLPPVWEQMIELGMITRADYDGMIESGSFQKLFDKLHSGQDYSDLVVSHEAWLPGHRGAEAPGGRQVFELPEGREYNIVFVDGCKSWYGTKHWIVRMCDRVRPGCHFVFQDYGWYTCFWLPSLVAVLEDHFRLVAYVDDTYAFELVKPLDVATVEERFADDPAGFGLDQFDDVFMKLGVDAGVRSDVHAMVCLTIQHAGALAYLGMKDEARQHIANMLGRPEFFPFRARFIDQALVSPTYTPDGPINL